MRASPFPCCAAQATGFYYSHYKYVRNLLPGPVLSRRTTDVSINEQYHHTVSTYVDGRRFMWWNGGEVYLVLYCMVKWQKIKKNRLFRFTITLSSSTPVACGCVDVCMCLCVREFRVRRVGRFSYSFLNIHLKTIVIILNGNKITICTRPCERFFHGESSEETSPTFE